MFEEPYNQAERISQCENAHRTSTILFHVLPKLMDVGQLFVFIFVTDFHSSVHVYIAHLFIEIKECKQLAVL